MYMAHGGTTFGMNTGANWKPEIPGSYEPQVVQGWVNGASCEGGSNLLS